MNSKLYTKTGDDGETSLFGGKRVKKSDLRVEAYGTIDELNAAVGAVLPLIQEERTRAALQFLMHKLFNCASNTATPPDGDPPRAVILSEDIAFLENCIDWMDQAAGPIAGFVLPTGTPAAGLLHLARTICRRAERRLVQLSETEPVNESVLKFINRASDFLFAAARLPSAVGTAENVFWDRTMQPPSDDGAPG